MSMSVTGSGQLGIPGSSPILLVTESKFVTNSSRSSKEYKIGHRRVDEDGQVTYKKKPTSELMTAIQLGIGQSIGGLSPKPKRDVLYGDFDVVESIFFPREGSSSTPAHRCSDFRFKTYAPIAFRYFRDLFSIQPEDFLLSLCNEPLKELSNPGASGSIFYLSNDDEFIIKTVQKKEAEFLQKLLPGYYMNLNQNPRTLLPKFYGLYCYQCSGKNIRFIIMNNLLPSTIEMHSKFDLKGSSYKRKASPNELTKTCPTYKDLDFLVLYPDGLFLEPETHSAFIKTVERDCRVLQSFKIMDYSMLIGIHRFESQRPKEISTVIDHKLKLNKVRMAQFSTALESIHAETDSNNLDFMNASLGGIPALTPNGEKIFLYIGIIDILQSYRFTKKLEHTFKSFIADGDTISVHRPGFYAQRFQSFFAVQVFKKITPSLKHIPSKKKSLTEKQKIFAGEGLEYIDAHPSKDFLMDNSSPLPPYSASKLHFKSLSDKNSSIDMTSNDIMISSPHLYFAKANNYIKKFDINLPEKSSENSELNEERYLMNSSNDNVLSFIKQKHFLIRNMFM